MMAWLRNRLVSVLALLAICVAGCGGGRKIALGTLRRAPATKQPSAATSPAPRPHTSPSYQLRHLSQPAREYRRAFLAKVAAINASARFQPHLLNDGDKDQPGDRDGDNGYDTGKDPYIDYLPPTNNRVYHDEDDEPYLALGKAASAREERASATVATRYYAAAFARDGARACTLMAPWLAKTALSKALELGRVEHGPQYPRNITSCTAVLSLLFGHLHRQLPSAIEVTDVRISGAAARVFFGAKTIGASQIILHREDGRWRIVQLIGKRLA